jgi:hypothetical protein
MDVTKRILEFASTYTGATHSQLGQDIMVMALTGHKHGGYFVEFGVMYGVQYSNTAVLEQELGWRGIVCEPGRVFHAALLQNRTCSIDLRAVHEVSGQHLEFKETLTELGLSGLTEFFDSNEMHTARRQASTGATYLVQTVSLNDLLDQHQAPDRLDYMSMDTEGSEHAILGAFDFDRHRAAIFSIEHNYLEPRRQQIKNIMLANGYHHIVPELSGHDDWFIDPSLL